MKGVPRVVKLFFDRLGSSLGWKILHPPCVCGVVFPAVELRSGWATWFGSSVLVQILRKLADFMSDLCFIVFPS
jgi:hypothetical protein